MWLDLPVDQVLNGVLLLIRLYGLPPDTLLLGFTLVSIARSPGDDTVVVRRLMTLRTLLPVAAAIGVCVSIVGCGRGPKAVQVMVTPPAAVETT